MHPLTFGTIVVSPSNKPYIVTSFMSEAGGWLAVPYGWTPPDANVGECFLNETNFGPGGWRTEGHLSDMSTTVVNNMTVEEGVTLSDTELRIDALEKAMELVGDGELAEIINYATQFHRFLSNQIPAEAHGDA